MKARRPRGSLCLQIASKILLSRGVETGEKKIFDQLRMLGFLSGRNASIDAIKRGLVFQEAGEFIYGDASGFDCYTRVFITRKGLDEAERRLRRPIPEKLAPAWGTDIKWAA